MENNPQNNTPNEENTKEKINHLGWRDLLKLSVRAFKVRPMRTFLTMLGMSVGIGTVFFLISLGYGLQGILLGKLAPSDEVLSSLEAFYPGEGGVLISQDLVRDTEAQKDVAEVSPVAEVAGEVTYNDLTGSVIVRAVKPNYFLLEGTEADIGIAACDTNNRGVIVSSTALQLLNLPDDSTTLGTLVKLQVVYQENGIEGETTLVEATELQPIVGIINDEVQAPFVYIGSHNLSQEPQAFTRMFVRAKKLDTLENVRSYLIQNGFLISAKIDTVTQARRITTAITITLGVFGIAALIVSSIGMFNTMLISFMERIFEVGIMKSIGATKRDILNIFMTESFLMGLGGGIGGIFLGVVIGQGVNGALNLLAHYLGGKPITLFMYPWKFVIFIILLSSLVGIFAGFWPARRAAVLSAREAFLRK